MFFLGLKEILGFSVASGQTRCIRLAKRLALGTVQFGMPYGVANKGGQVSFKEARSILQIARSAGVDTLDTAIAYGTSEQVLGELGVRDWQVITKLPGMPEGCGDVGEWVQKSVQTSFQRLNVSRVRGLLLHKPQQLLEAGGDKIYEALSGLKRDGLVEKIGFSIYSPAELDVLWDNFRPDMIQAPFNVLDRRLENSGWLCKLHAAGVEIHVRSVFLQGLLLMDEVARPAKFQRWSGYWKGWHEWLAEKRLTPLQAALGFALAKPEIDRVVVGVDTLIQLNEILQVANGEIPEVPIEINCNDINLINPANW